MDAGDRLDAESRGRYIEKESANGLVLVVAHSRVDYRPLGFVELVPIETAARDVTGEGAMFLHCILVLEGGAGIGRALLGECERLAQASSRGLVVDGCHDVYGFMPASYFARQGFVVAESRGSRRLMYKNPAGAGKPGIPVPRYLEPSYRIDPPQGAPPGVVVVDVFHTPLCTGHRSPEFEVMRQAAARYGERVTVRSWDAGDPEIRRRYGIARAIFVNGAMRPNGDTIKIEEASRLLDTAFQRGTPIDPPSWDDSISRLF